MKYIIFTDVKNILSALEFTKLQNQIIKYSLKSIMKLIRNK